MTEGSPISDPYDHYVRLLDEHRWLANGLCWTVIQPVSGLALSLDEVGSRLTGGGDPEVREMEIRGEDLYPLEVVFVGRSNGATILLQKDGGAHASSPEVMSRLSVDARLWNVSWQSQGAGRLSHSVYGRILADVYGLDVNNATGADPDALAPEIEPLRRAAVAGQGEATTLKEAWGRKTAALTVIELATGARLLEEWLSAPQSAFVIDQPIAIPPEPLAFGQIDPDLDARLRLSARSIRQEVLLFVARYLSDRYDLDREFLAAVTEKIGQGIPLDRQARDHLLETQLEWSQEITGPLLQEGAESDHENLRLAALIATRHALLEAGGRADNFQALTYAKHVLGPAWPALRATIRASLGLQ
ncbi:hypothetical protein [Sphaerisporangium rhizosphaerae]|uniref:Uncharacterized protein n=1 Tax=Sphaerisporangium rhizosphaerae TaxID=2269375 RepID=A0ABW2P0U1_9ACTN